MSNTPTLLPEQKHTTPALAEHEKDCAQCRDAKGWLDLCAEGYKLVNPAAFPTRTPIETPERIWLLNAMIEALGVEEFVLPPHLRADAVEYVRADLASGIAGVPAQRALQKFGHWYMTLSHLNPDAFLQLKEIIPAQILIEMADAAGDGEQAEQDQG